MKKIKVIFTAAVLAVIGGSAFAQETPVFNQENSTVIDTADAGGKIKDNVKLVNESEEENMKFSVYAYAEKKKEWKIIGKGFLKEFYDSDTIDSPLEGTLGKYRYFAVVSESGKPFAYRIEKKRNDLYIYVQDANPSTDESYKSTAYVIDAGAVPGSFKDTVRFTNMSADENISFMVYAFNSEEEQWQKAGVAILKDFGDSDGIDSPLDDKLKDFKYFGIVSRNGKDYKYTVTKQRNDLCIAVE